MDQLRNAGLLAFLSCRVIDQVPLPAVRRIWDLQCIENTVVKSVLAPQASRKYLEEGPRCGTLDHSMIVG